MDFRISNATPDAIGLQEPHIDDNALDEQSEQIKNHLANIFGSGGGLTGALGMHNLTTDPLGIEPRSLLPTHIGTVVSPAASLPVAGGNVMPLPMSETNPAGADGLVNPQAKSFSDTSSAPPDRSSSVTSVASDTSGDASRATSDSAPTFGAAAKTLNDWMHTNPSMQGKGDALTLDDLNDIANGVGKGAGASADVQNAAKVMVADGGAQYKQEIGGKDGKASAKDFAKFVANDKDTPLTNDEMATLAVLDRHGAALKGKTSDIQSKIDDKNTPSDLKTALQQLQKDPSLMDMLDAGKKGNVDGKIGGDDVSRLVAKHPEMIAYNQQQASTYVDNYIPSDDKDSHAQPRAMTANDAMRELYRYSDYLPKNISKQTLQDIVNGTGGEGKAPPQVIAAAQYYLNNPSAFQTVAGTGNSISRGHMEDAISKNISLDQDETDTLQTLSDNKSTFFGGGNLTRDKLKSIANDPKSSDKVKQAAQQLLNDPMLFGMLDNGKKGSSGNLIYAADDGKISRGDFDAFTKNLKSYGQPAVSTPPTHEATSTSAIAATQAMEAGTEDQPEQKKSKGGGLIKFFQGILHVFSKILDVVSTVLGALAKIPGIGALFAGASMATKFVSGQTNVAADAVGGASKGQIADDEKQAGEGLGEAALGIVAGPGVGGAVAKGAEKGIEAGTSATSAAVKDGVKDAAKDQASDQVQQTGTQEYQQRNTAPA